MAMGRLRNPPPKSWSRLFGNGNRTAASQHTPPNGNIHRRKATSTAEWLIHRRMGISNPPPLRGNDRTPGVNIAWIAKSSSKSAANNGWHEIHSPEAPQKLQLRSTHYLQHFRGVTRDPYTIYYTLKRLSETLYIVYGLELRPPKCCK